MRASRMAAAVLLALAAIGATLLLLPGAPRPADAQVAGLYVDRASVGGACSDARPAEQVSVTTPWCSLTRAQLAPSGGRVIVRGGTYPALTLSGAHPNVTIAAAPGETVSVAGVTFSAASGVGIEGFTLTAPVDVGEGSSNIRVARSRLVNSNIVVRPGAKSLVFEDNSITAPNSNGLIFSGAAGPPIEDVTIARNTFDNIGIAGLNIRNFRRVRVERNTLRGVHRWTTSVHPDVIRTYGGGQDLVIDGNYLTANEAQGIFTKDGRVDRLTITNNVIVRNGKWLAMNLYDAHDVLIANNTIMDNQGGVIVRTNASGVDLRNNIVDVVTIEGYASIVHDDFNYVGQRKGATLSPTAAAGLRGLNNVTSGIQFVNPAAGDYRLAKGSAGVDAGSSERAPAVDRQGRGRFDYPDVPNRGSTVDLGAEESQIDTPVAAAGAPAALGGGEERFRTTLAATGRQKLVRRTLRADVACTEACVVDGVARVRIGKKIRSTKLTRLNLAAGERGTFVLRFGPRTASEIRRLVRRQGRVRATVLVRASNSRRQRATAFARIDVVRRVGDASKPLSLRVAAPPPQRLRGGRLVRARMTCSVACRLRARARVRLGRQIVESKTKIRRLRAGRTTSVLIAFSPRTASRVRRLLRRSGAVNMTVVASATDDLGRRTTGTTRIRVRRP